MFSWDTKDSHRFDYVFTKLRLFEAFDTQHDEDGNVIQEKYDKVESYRSGALDLLLDGCCKYQRRANVCAGAADGH